jgi:predicted Zn finger-like uncharacterized protein
MILTCPQCGSRFSLDAALLAPNGRKVRCAACKHTWHQLPDPAELGETLPADTDEEIDADFARLEAQAGAGRPPRFQEEDIPRALRPDAEDRSPAEPSARAANGKRRRQILSGVLGALAVLVPAGVLFLTLQSTLVSVWPASYALYEALGIARPVPGEGLIFEKMKADLRKTLEGKTVLHIEGQIINLKKEAQTVPMIEATLKGETGELFSRWLIAPPEGEVKGENSMPFSAETAFKDEKAISVNLRFLAGEPEPLETPAKTASGDGENTPAPPAGGTAHPSGHEEPSESPPHGDAPPHPESPPAHTGNSDHPSDPH